MIQRLLVTGSGGFVAGSVIAQSRERLGEEWEVHALSRGPIGTKIPPFVKWHCEDSIERGNLDGLFSETQPDVLIHSAAIADIDFCEGNRETARRVNVDFTRDLAELCAEHKTKMIFLSTDTIFDGERGNYCEEDAPREVNFYAQTKIKAEHIVMEASKNWVVARLALVMGLPLLGEGNSFLSRMIASWESGKKLGVPDNEIRTPIDVVTLGRALLELAASNFTGVLHLAGNDRLNRFEMAKRIARKFGYDESLVFAHDPSAIPGRAPRPRDVSLNNAKARAALKTPMVGLDGGLDLIRGMK